jgi:hypothetical protein
MNSPILIPVSATANAVVDKDDITLIVDEDGQTLVYLKAGSGVQLVASSQSAAVLHALLYGPPVQSETTPDEEPAFQGESAAAPDTHD